MNIGFFSEMANVEGSAFHMVRQLRWMLANGHRAVMFSSGGTLEPLLEEMRVPHVRIESVKQNVELTAEQLCADGAILERAATRYDLDAIVTAPSWPFPLAQAAVGNRIPVFLQILSPAYRIPATPQSVQMIRAAAEQGRVLANVYEDALPHAQQFGFDIERVRLQNLPIDDASAKPNRSREEVRAELGIGDDEVLVLSACRLDTDRFPFINPMAHGVKALRDGGRRVRLMIAGDGIRAAELRASAPEGTSYLGLRRDMADLYAAADVFCGEGSTVMEAARAGLPVVMSCALTQPAAAAYAYAVFGVHIVDQFWWKSNTVIPPTPFAEALAPFIDDPELRRRVGKAGCEMVVDHWSVDKYMQWLLDVVAGKNPASFSAERAECVIEIEGWISDDFDRVAQVLASCSAQVGVDARAAIPWERYLTIPTEHAQAMTRAARRLQNPAAPRYRTNGFALSPVEDRHRFIAELFEGLPDPPTAMTPAIDFGKRVENTVLVLADGSDLERVLQFARQCNAGTAVLCWLKGEAEHRAMLSREWNLRRNPHDNIELFVVEGAMPWTFVGRLFSAAARYVDCGQKQFAHYRRLAKAMSLSIGLLPHPQELKVNS